MPDPAACETALRQVSDLIAGDLDGGDAAALDRHLASCESCYRRSVILLRQDRALTQMAARRNVLSYSLPEQNRRSVLLPLMGAAAAAALLIAAFFSLTSPKPTAPMVVASVTGKVLLDDTTAQAGDEIKPGQNLVTGGNGAVTIRFLDSTIVEVAEKTTVRNLREADGKRMTLVKGSVSARVAPQSKPMILESKSGEARVLGTTLRLVVDDELDQTRLEVTEGKVQLTRWADKKSVDVAAGHFAVAAAGVELTARPLSKGRAPADLFQLDYVTLRGMLQLRSKAWATLPWRVSLAEAREVAFREKKPIFMVISSGHPLGYVGSNGVIAREYALNDPEIGKLLVEKFVLLAMDSSVHPHPDEFPWLDAHELGYRLSTFGFVVFSPDGTRLAHGNVFEPGQARTILNAGLKAFKAPAGPLEEIPRKGGTPLRQIPEGGAVAQVTWKGFYDDPEAFQFKTQFQQSLGSDRLWIRKDEVDALAKRIFPASLKNRILKFNYHVFVGSQTRFDIAIDDLGRIQGKASGDQPAEDIFVQGFVEVRDGKLVRFDLVARGEGGRMPDGFFASLMAAPKGRRVPLAVCLELGNPEEPINRVLPHQATNPAYLK